MRRTLVGIALPVMLAAGRPGTAEDLPVGLHPYRVTISIAFEDAPEFPPEFRSFVSQDVLRALGRALGERWIFTDGTSAGSRFADLADLAPSLVPVPRRPAEGSASGFPAENAPDKYFFIVLGRDGPRFTVAAREWDRLTDGLGPVRTVSVATRDELPRAAATVVLAAFRPVAAVEPTADGAMLMLRAGAIPSPDPVATAFPAGTLFTLVLRKYDRDGVTAEVRRVPYTYLESEAPGEGVAEATLRSALRKPLAGTRGRVEAWAIAAPPIERETRLVLTRRDDGAPLVGRIIEVRGGPAEPGKEVPPAERTLLSDRSGAVRLPVDPERALVWLTVKSGDAILMRLPVAPGVDQEVVLPLGDDQRRIDAESRIAIITGELIETVAKRATLLVKARAGARAGKYEQADAALPDAAGLADVASFRRRIAAVETPAAEAAEKAGDRMAAARIRALGRKSTALVDRYLNPEALRTTVEEVEELKRTDPDRVPPKPEPTTATPAPVAERKASEPAATPASPPAQKSGGPAKASGPRF